MFLGMWCAPAGGAAFLAMFRSATTNELVVVGVPPLVEATDEELVGLLAPA
jgi:hypothetical protein